MRTATASGWVIAMRLGIRSAIKIKLPVTSEKVSKEATVLPQLPAFSNSLPKYGRIAASPTIPARMATAFKPIWTTVIKTARLLLHIDYVKRTRIAAIFRHNLQFDFACRSKREFGTGYKRANDNQQAQ